MNELLTIVEHTSINVASLRDISKKTISYEDRNLLFDITYKDIKGKLRYIFKNNGKNSIKATSIVGSVSLKNGLTVEILPKFAKGNLTKDAIKIHRKTLISMIRVSNEKNFITSQSQSSKISMEEMPLINYIIELFTINLLDTLRQGLYRSYTKKTINSNYIRGSILVSKTMQNNFIDKSKVYTSFNNHSYNNHLMQVFRTLSKILLQDGNLSYRTKQNLYEIYQLLDGVNTINLKSEDFTKVTFNRLNDKYELLFQQANFIYNKYMPFSSKINSTPFWSILFNMDYLFEKFIAYLFRKSDIDYEEQNSTDVYTNNDKTVTTRPDFVLYDEEEQIVSVADAKWKLLSNDKSLYGLNAQNFWQLFSYMNLINQDKEITGYFIVPKNSDEFEDEINFQAIKDGNKAIGILSIDFSLDFSELVKKYRFELVESALKLRQLEVEKLVIEKNISVKTNSKVVKYEYIKEEDIALCHSNDEEIILNLAQDKNTRDELKIILFYRKYNHILFKEQIKEILLTNSSINLKQLFKKNIVEIKDFIDYNYLKIQQKYLYGFIYCDHNASIHCIKEVIAKNTKSSIMINYLAKENHRTIFYNILKNRNIINSEYIVTSEILEEIVIYTKQQSNVKMAIELVKREEISLDIIKDIIKYFKSGDIVSAIKDNNYYDININIWIKEIGRFYFYDYSKLSLDVKLDFIIEVNFQYYDSSFIKKLCYEKELDILEELLADKHETLPIRFIMLIYVLNINDNIFKAKYLFQVVKKKKNGILIDLLELHEKKNINAIVKYIENRFSNIDNEILFGYAMSNNEESYHIRKKICYLTNDLNLLDEFSKNRYDKDILLSIVYHTKNNPDFTNIIKGNSTIYSTVILDRISKYDRYYIYNDESCLIAKVANSFNLNKSTRFYLLNKYENDKVILEALNNDSLDWDRKNLSSLKDILCEKLSIAKPKQLFNQIDFSSIDS